MTSKFKLVYLCANKIENMRVEMVILKVSSWEEIMRFGKKGKLSPRFIGPFEISKRFRKVAYEPALPKPVE
jgi:hypothetical protein